MSALHESSLTKGFSAAFFAYLCWGFFPLYWALFGSVNSWEVIAHRIIWTFFLISAFLWIRGSGPASCQTSLAVLKNPVQLINLFSLALLAALNWWVNVYGVVTGHVVELGIGMFITPLLTVFLGMLFFKERLSPIKKVSVMLPIAGVGIMIAALGSVPWFAIGVSGSWAMYGVFKKRIAIDPWVSTVLEAALMLPIALSFLLYLASSGEASFIAGGGRISLLLFSVGIVTAIPMVAYSYATNNLPFTIFGFFQYINPILTIFVGIAFLGDSWRDEQTLPLMLIWSGIALFIFAQFRERIRRPQTAAA